MYVEQLLAVAGKGEAVAGVLGVVGVVERLAQGREVARLLQALDGGLAAAGQPYVLAESRSVVQVSGAGR